MLDIIVAMVQLTAIGFGVALFIACLTAPKQVLKYVWKTLVAMKKAYDEHQKNVHTANHTSGTNLERGRKGDIA